MRRLVAKYHDLPAGMRVALLIAAGLPALVSNLVYEHSLLTSFALAVSTTILWFLALLVWVHRGTSWGRGDWLTTVGILVSVLFIPVASQGDSGDDPDRGARPGPSAVQAPTADDVTETADPTESRLTGITVTQGLTQSELSGYTGYLLFGSDSRLLLLQVRGDFQSSSSKATDDLTLDFTFLPPGGGEAVRHEERWRGLHLQQEPGHLRVRRVLLRRPACRRLLHRASPAERPDWHAARPGGEQAVRAATTEHETASAGLRAGHSGPHDGPDSPLRCVE